MVLRITLFDESTQKQQLIKNLQALQTFLFTLDNSNKHTYIVENVNRSSNIPEKRVVMNCDELMENLQYNIEGQK